LKKELKYEPYLEVYHRGGIPELAKIRGGSNRLRIEQGRYVKEDINQRLCRCCNSGSVEDEAHFMLHCSVYDDLREQMWSKVYEITGRSKASFADEDSMLNALIGDFFQNSRNGKTKDRYSKLVRCIMIFITSAMSRRRKLLDEVQGHVRPSER
jgi:hypothetical protein